MRCAYPPYKTIHFAMKMMHLQVWLQPDNLFTCADNSVGGDQEMSINIVGRISAAHPPITLVDALRLSTLPI
jgi:hypothetical protein